MSAKLEQRLLRQGLVDLRLLGRERESDSRFDVVRHYCELLLSFSLGGERARCCERGLFRLPLHARARVDHERGAEPLGAALADRRDCHQAADRLAVLEHPNGARLQLHAVGKGQNVRPAGEARVGRLREARLTIRAERGHRPGETGERHQGNYEKPPRHCRAAAALTASGSSGPRIAKRSFGMLTPRFSNL